MIFYNYIRRVLIFLFFTGVFQVAVAQLDLSATRHDSSEPIDIKSDKLVLKTKENKAIFSGNVIAVQGKMNLHSDRMVVFYKNGGQKQKGESSITKIETEGNVKLLVPDREANSDKGVYDVKSSLVTLSGNVVLKKDGNTLAGEKFVYDVSKRTSKMSGGKGSDKKSDGKSKPGRVKAVLSPK